MFSTKMLWFLRSLPQIGSLTSQPEGSSRQNQRRSLHSREHSQKSLQSTDGSTSVFYHTILDRVRLWAGCFPRTKQSFHTLDRRIPQETPARQASQRGVLSFYLYQHSGTCRY